MELEGDPRRGAALNTGAVVDSLPNGLLDSMRAAHQSGETMAGTRTRLDATLMSLMPDPVSSDVWADPAKAGVTRLRTRGSSPGPRALRPTAELREITRQGTVSPSRRWNYPPTLQTLPSPNPCKSFGCAKPPAGGRGHAWCISDPV